MKKQNDKMAISELDKLKKNLSDFCKNKKQRIDFLKNVNGKRDYKELAILCGIKTPANSIRLINEAEGFELIVKDEKTDLADKCSILKGRNIDSLLKESLTKKTISIRKKCLVDISQVKKSFKKYAHSNFNKIANYFDENKSIDIEPKKIETAVNEIFSLLENKKKIFEIEGIELRFFTAFAEYFNESRIESHNMANKFSAIIKLYEPFIKKFLIIKTNDESWAKQSLNESMLNSAYDITDNSFNIKETKEDYWKKRSVKETSIRIAFKYRNIESHSATQLKSFDMDKIIFHIFAAIIFLYDK